MLSDASRDALWSWRSLVVTDLVYKFVAFALLTPGTLLLLRWLISGGQARVIADTELATFFVTTRVGALALLLGGAILAAITALEMGCLMVIGLAAAERRAVRARDALAFGVARAPFVLGLTAHMLVRLLAGLLPFVLAGGVVYWAFLRDHDINFYLAERPPSFWAAAVCAALILAALASLLLWVVSRWALALPLVLFERVAPRRALGESSRRTRANRRVVVTALAAWAIVAVALVLAASGLPEAVGRVVAPRLAGSLAALLAFVMGLAATWVAAGVAAGIVNASLFALIHVHLYLRIGEPREPRGVEGERAGARSGIPRAVWIGGTAVALLAVSGLVLIAVGVARRSQSVLVIAHRGSSAEAPENTLAAFRLAGEQGADFVELDVQESSDGQVVVVHDKDLMKVGGAGLKVWETSAAQLRSVDIGSHAGARFSGERVPTLSEALATCKGRSRVIVELKSYGHDQRLEERVGAIVEAAGMERDCIFMSLDHAMVGKMKRLRPTWTCGVLVAKALGDLTSLHADFLAVESKLATRSFVRRAHGAGQEVYVWTVNDPAGMLAALARGVDGLITDRPDLARRVVARHAGLSDAQRVLVALLVRLGARTEDLLAEDALRP